MKTVCPQGRVGSNPTLSAREFFFRNEIGLFTINRLIKLWRNTQEAEGAPLEREKVVNSGARVQIPLSPLAAKLSKKQKKFLKKLLTNEKGYDIL